MTPKEIEYKAIKKKFMPDKYTHVFTHISYGGFTWAKAAASDSLLKDKRSQKGFFYGGHQWVYGRSVYSPIAMYEHPFTTLEDFIYGNT